MTSEVALLHYCEAQDFDFSETRSHLFGVLNDPNHLGEERRSGCEKENIMWIIVVVLTLQGKKQKTKTTTTKKHCRTQRWCIRCR